MSSNRRSVLVLWNISTVLVPTKYIWRYKPQNANYITSGIPHRNYSLLYLKLASHNIKLKGKIPAHWLIIFISIYLGWHQTVNNKHDHRLRVRPQKEEKLFSTFNTTFLPSFSYKETYISILHQASQMMYLDLGVESINKEILCRKCKLFLGI